MANHHRDNNNKNGYHNNKQSNHQKNNNHDNKGKYNKHNNNEKDVSKEIDNLFKNIEMKMKNSSLNHLILDNITTEKFKFQRDYVQELSERIIKFRTENEEKVGRKFPKIELLDIKNNGIRHLGFLQQLASAFPSVRVLHVENNDISDLKSYNDIYNFKYLQHLYIDNLGVNSDMDMNHLGLYLLDSCPSLKSINDMPIAVSQTDFIVYSETKKNIEKQGSNIEENIQGPIWEFFYAYIDAFDYDRGSTKFSNYYNDQSLLSMTIEYTLDIPKEIKEFSRDLRRSHHKNWNHKLLIRGMNVPGFFHKEFPYTKHLGIGNKPDIVDSHCLLNDKLVSMVFHGQVELNNQYDTTEKTVVGYDRHWVLILRGGRIFIQNDHINLKAINEQKELDPNNNQNLILLPSKREMLHALSQKYNIKSELLMSIVIKNRWDFRHIEQYIMKNWRFMKFFDFNNNSKPNIQFEQPPMQGIGYGMPPQPHQGPPHQQHGPPPHQQQGPPHQYGPPQQQYGQQQQYGRPQQQYGPPQGHYPQGPPPNNGYGPPPNNNYGRPQGPPQQPGYGHR